jgi:peroxiredoxin
LTRSGRTPRFASVLVAIVALSCLPARVALAQKMPQLEPLPGNRAGNMAPEFTLKDLADHKYSLKELRGKRVVHVVFWATWCVPCMQEIPQLRAIQEKYQDRGFQILGVVVNMNQTIDGVKAVARTYKINYPLLWDDGGEVQDRYKVNMIPQNFLIGKDGVIRYAGATLPGDYGTLVDSLLKEGVAPSSAPTGR